MNKLKLINGESILSIVLFIIGVIWIAGAFIFNIWTTKGPGPGLMLLIIGIMLTIFAYLIFGKSLKSLKEGEKLSNREKKAALWTIGLCIVGMISVNFLGMFFTLTVGLLLWFTLVAKYNWWKTLLSTTCIIASMYGIFVVWLSVAFPKFFDLF